MQNPATTYKTATCDSRLCSLIIWRMAPGVFHPASAQGTHECQRLTALRSAYLYKLQKKGRWATPPPSLDFSRSKSVSGHAQTVQRDPPINHPKRVMLYEIVTRFHFPPADRGGYSPNALRDSAAPLGSSNTNKSPCSPSSSTGDGDQAVRSEVISRQNTHGQTILSLYRFKKTRHLDAEHKFRSVQQSLRHAYPMWLLHNASKAGLQASRKHSPQTNNSHS
jgi:hypothetical protein